MQWIWIVFVIVSIVSSINASKRKAEEAKRVKSPSAQNSNAQSQVRSSTQSSSKYAARATFGENSAAQKQNQAARRTGATLSEQFTRIRELIENSEPQTMDSAIKTLSKAVSGSKTVARKPAQKTIRDVAPLTVFGTEPKPMGYEMGFEGEEETDHRKHQADTARFYDEHAEEEAFSLSFAEDDIINAIIYSEILGKPKTRKAFAR